MSDAPWKLRHVADSIGPAGWPGYANTLNALAGEIEEADSAAVRARARVECLEAAVTLVIDLCNVWSIGNEGHVVSLADAIRRELSPLEGSS